MVSFARKGDASENPLAKLLQATQDVIDKESDAAETASSTNKQNSDENDRHSSNGTNKKISASPLLGAAGNAIPPVSPFPPPPVAFMSGPLVAQAAMISAHPLYGPEPEEESCGRPFCKLKRRPHYHCNLCNQGFTEKDKLETHLKRHTEPPPSAAVAAGGAATPSLASLLAAAKDPNAASSALNHFSSDSAASTLLASAEQALKQQQAMLAVATASEQTRNLSPNRGGNSPLISSTAGNQHPLSPGSRSGRSTSPTPSLGGGNNNGLQANSATSSTPTSTVPQNNHSSSFASSTNIPSVSPRPSSTGSGSSSSVPVTSIGGLTASNVAAAAAAASLFPPGMVPPAFSVASPFGMRHLALTSASGMPSVATSAVNAGVLLPPGLNPFFPPGFLQLPGLASHNLFQPRLPGSHGDIPRIPGAPGTPGVSGVGGMVFDPLKHPLTRMPGDPSLSSLKRNASSPMSSMLLDDDNGLTLEEKKLKLQSSMRMLKDEPVPEGYMRFR